jgi:aarF domain-containing kinase
MEYGRSWPDFLQLDSETPIGVGAIAQVYRGTLLKSQKQVAVKVLHPGVAELIQNDLTLLHFMASCVHAIPGLQWLSFPDEVNTFGRMMMAQLDLRNEVRNLDLFQTRFHDRPGIRFPKPFKRYQKQSVLIEEYISGVPIHQFLTLGPSVYDSDLAAFGFESFLVSLKLLSLMMIENAHFGQLCSC